MDLAYVSEIEDTQRNLRELQREGVYDTTRRIRRISDSYTEIPIEQDIEEEGTACQLDPTKKQISVSDLVEVEEPPSSWSIVGEVIDVELSGYSKNDKKEIANALLDLHRGCHTVISTTSITGRKRTPEVEVIAGEGETHTVHRENGYEFELDLSEVMFSKGNQHERKRIQMVTQRNETVYDMFAGIGYFSIPAATTGATVVAAEINPYAHRYLERNTERNNVDIQTHLGSCREIQPIADRVLMGHFNSTEYLDHALNCLEQGWIHLHYIANSETTQQTESNASQIIEEKGREVLSKETSMVKQVSSTKKHYVKDLEIR